MKKLALSALALLLTACSLQTSDNIEADTSAKGILDYDNNLIILPLDEYKYTENDMLNYQKAFDIVYGSCFTAKGKNYTPQDYTPIGNRIYGLWNLEQAQKYGFGGSSETSAQAINDPETMTACESEASVLDNLSPISKKHQELIDSISRSAFSAAQNNPTWKSEREEWWQCLENQGLTPRKGDNDWGTEQGVQGNISTNLEESIRIASIEAQCSQETEMAQTLANLEASYQAPLIKENQSQLNQAKEELNTQRKKLEEFITTRQ